MSGSELEKDVLTRSQIVILLQHNEIHEGGAFVLSASVTLPVANDYEIRIQTPDTERYVHMEFEAISDATLTASIYENTALADVVANRLTPRNRNRNYSDNISVLTICHTPSGSGDGTQIWTRTVGSLNPLTGGTAANTRREWILKRNTAYLIRLAGAQGDVVNYIFDWYEHKKE